jgi:MFS family permease
VRSTTATSAGGGAPRAAPASPDGSSAAGRRLYYGWVLVVTLGVTETISWGVLYYAFSALLAPMQADLGWSRGALTGAFSLAVVLSALAAVPVGRWLDRHGARALMTAGSCAGVALVLAWSQASTIPGFYAVWAAIGVVQAAVLYEPAFAVVAVWFHRRRGRALTTVTLFAGFASTVFLPLTAWLVQAQGWRAALVSLAALLAVGTILPHALVLRRRPEDLGLRPDGAAAAAGPEDTGPAAGAGVSLAEALHDPRFYWLAVAFCLSSLAAFGLTVHLVPVLQGRGFDATAAATLAGLVGATQVLGRLVLGPMGDRVPLRSVAPIVLALQPLAILVLLLVPALAGVVAFIVLFGAAKGVLTLVRPAFVAEVYGRAHYASIAGVLAFAVTLANALGPVGVGAAYDRLGDYDPILWALLAIGAAASLAAVPASSGRGRSAAA